MHRVTTFCLDVGAPTCTSDDACPSGETCSLGPFLEGAASAEGEPRAGGAGYRLCSGFALEIAEDTGEQVDCGCETIHAPVEASRYVLNLDDARCLNSTGSPLSVRFLEEPPRGRLRITPRR